MHAPLPLTREIVLIGGGHAHALLLRRWGMDPLPGARLTLINPAPTAPYTGMLPGFVAGHYTRDQLEIDLVRLARFADARMIFGSVSGIDRTARTVRIDGRPPVPYDLAALDIGITSAMPELPGFLEHGIAAKPLGPFATRWRAHLDGAAGPVAVIGGGVGGVELALAMAHALAGRGAVTVVEAETALNGVGAPTRARLLDALRAANIALIEGTRPAEVTPTGLILEDGREVPACLTVGAAGARPFGWLEDTGLTLENGFVAVDETLRALNDPDIFAVGDCAHMSHAPRPKAGVFAVRAAPVLTDNLKAAASGGRLKPFRPQTHYLKLISLGPKAALADKWGKAAGGRWAWVWKDRIDRAFMDRLNQLRPMGRPALPRQRATGLDEALGDKPLCGGCGAKVAPNILSRVLDALPQEARADVLTGPGDDAAVLRIGGTRQVLTTDHLRAFWSDPWVFGRIAALHALGDVWAMGAAPQAVLTHITLPRLADPLQAAWLGEIMQAASDVFAAEGASIVGGHSTQGSELIVGFTVTGLTDAPLTLAGGQAGDALLLTRPIGSGTLFAAEMALQAQGEDIAEALGIMGQGQGDAARLLAPLAHAMTDVTGFGLAGHAARMAEASGLSARLVLQAVPLYAGAEALAAGGVRSTIWKANRDAVPVELPDTARTTLLFDPQTAGGLLAALPVEAARTARAALVKLGHRAEIIGALEPAGSGILNVT